MMHDEENTSDENFNNIMESITSKLTGNDKEDIPYLLDKIDEYKGHKYETEINRACWRIIYKLTPYEMKKKFEKIIDNHQLSVKKTLDMFLERGAISQAQHDKSLHDLIEKMGIKDS